ncbi:MAG: phosphatase PAP2 family protein [Bacillota bacterium]
MSDPSVILWLQRFSHPLLDRLFLAITWLGDEMFYILAISLLYWCWDRRLAYRLSYGFLVSMWFNATLKQWVNNPRPSPEVVRCLLPLRDPSFPSGHAQGSATFWLYLASQLRRCWFTVTAGLLVLLVGLSRIYLGVHYHTDVLFGWALGLGFVILLSRFADTLERGASTTVVAVSILLPLAMVLVHGSKNALNPAGFLFGVAIGYRLVGQQEPARAAALPKQLMRVILGLGLVLGLRVGLKLAFPESLVFDFIRYSLIGLVATVLPRFYPNLGLASGRHSISG